MKRLIWEAGKPKIKIPVKNNKIDISCDVSDYDELIFYLKPNNLHNGEFETYKIYGVKKGWRL